MGRTWIFGDLISHLFDRGAPMRGQEDNRSLIEICSALLSQEGEVSGLKLAATALDRYNTLTKEGRLEFFQYLNKDLDVDAQTLSSLAAKYANDKSVDTFKQMTSASEPRRQELLRRLNQPVGATDTIVQMRVDLLEACKEDPTLRRTDHDFVHLFRSWFNRGFLVLRQIDWDTPARILDKIVAYEAVHQIDDYDALRSRLSPADRKCYAYFHPSLPDEPLIFVEVALTDGVPGSIDDLLQDGRDPIDPSSFNTATFYSISNCQKGLAGISFGNSLIKHVVAEVSLQFPQIDTFVTLSPIPGLNTWLDAQQTDPDLGLAAQAVLEGRADDDTRRALAARYLLHAKRADGTSADPVARFHLGNGAEVHALHANADVSSNGLRQSSSVMVNYLYDLSRTEANHAQFVTESMIAASPSVQALATADLDLKSEEMSA